MGNKSLFENADVIYAYTRQQAIKDGVLVDVSAMAKEAGIKYPVALTRAVWSDIVEPDEIAKSHGESVQGRLWDVLWMFHVAAKSSNETELNYKVIATKEGRMHTRELKAICSPGDTPEPVITIMLPDED